MEQKFIEIHERLSKRVEEYINAIKEIYGEYLSPLKLEQLDNIKDYKEVLRIFDTGTINGSANDFHINLPLSADHVFDIMRKVPGYGINKKHKTYKGEDVIINDNTFFDYVFHVFVSGTNTEEYYEDLLLHETMHFCGGDGGTALKEGLNEFLTRKLAYEKGFRTNACGYPKEVKVAYELQQIFGEDTMNQIAFIRDEEYVLKYLDKTLGREAAYLYKRVSDEMEKEFDEKYYQYIDTYNGITGITKKVMNYKNINYDNIYKMINEYKEKKLQECRKNKTL